MNFFTKITIYFLAADVVNFVTGMRHNDDDNSNLPGKQTLGHSTSKEIERAIHRITRRLLSTDGENNSISKLESTILRKVEKVLQSRVLREEPEPSPSFDPTLLEAIEESVACNLKETLLQYSTKMIDEDIKKHSQSIPSNKSKKAEKNKGPSENKSFASLFSQNKDSATRIQPSRIDKPGLLVKEKLRDKTIISEQREDTSITMLIAPKIRGSRVFTDLLHTGIDPRHFNVKKRVEFPSGAALFLFNTEEDKEKMKKMVDKSGKFIIELQKKTYQRSVTVQKVPSTVTGDEMRENIEEQFGESPSGVNFLFSPNEKGSNSLNAVLHVSDSLHEAIRNHPSVRIRGRRHEIDTSISVTRCFNCHLLGHRSKFCQYPAQAPPTPDEDCLDCRHYNDEISELNTLGRRPRDVNHPTGDNNCTTKQYLESLWQRQRGEG